MYLSKGITIYVMQAEDKKVNLTEVAGLRPFGGNKDLIVNTSKVDEVIVEAVYWRKDNHIHNWFVNNCQNGVDDCERYRVTKEQLEELVRVCKLVLGDHSKANELLPTQRGFFFGSTDYDEFYYDSLEYTVEEIEKLLKEDEGCEVDYYYRSSW